MSDTRYPITIHISEEMATKIDRPVDAAIISNRPGGGNTTQSFLKGDIIADQLNAVFGPLGWGVEARIHQMDDWDETKTVSRNNQPKDVSMHMVQVVSDVKLTIKKTTPDGTDTVFVQPGIGYGEAEEGKSRKEAFGMAVKGAATDGLKRCATLVGKAFGMMMASNGSQEDIEYAHNGKQQNLRKAQEMRRTQGAQQRQQPRQIEDRSQQREEAPRQQEERQRPQAQEQRPREEPRREPERARDDSRQQDGGDAQRRPEVRDGVDTMERPAEPARREEPPKADATVKEEVAKPAPAKRGADTNYPLDSLPITKQDMTDFGATLVERVKEMRQHTDRVGLVKQHLNTIKNLDSAIRRRVIDRLREVDVDVDKIPS